MTEQPIIQIDLPISEHSLYQKNNTNKNNSLFVLSKEYETEQMMVVPQQNEHNANNNRMKLQRKRGRIKKSDNDNISSPHFTNGNPSNTHSKYFQDNIKRKIKTHFHNFIIAFLNIESKKQNQSLHQFRFKKMESAITQDIRISENKKLLQRPLKEILGNVSKKFKDQEQNNKYMNYIYLDGGHMKELLEMKYETIFNNYYLKSTHQMFENTGEKDESFEEHLDLIKKKDGILYMKQYKKNAETFVEFFKNNKERKRNTFKHINKDSSSKQEIIQHSINKLNDVNNNNSVIINANEQNEIIKNINYTLPIVRSPPILFRNVLSTLPFQQRNTFTNNCQSSYSNYNLNHLHNWFIHSQNNQYVNGFYYQ